MTSVPFLRFQLTLEEFETLVYEAWEDIPPEFAERIENLAVMVEDLPSRQDIQKLKLQSPLQLLGVYRGVPLPHRGIYSAVPVMPDVIVIFRIPILSICGSLDNVQKQVRSTLAHELGHYFGLDEVHVRRAMKHYLD